MAQRKIIIPIAIVAAAGAFAAWKFTHTGADPDVLKLSGNIELTEVDMSFKYPGRLAQLAVGEGDMVKAQQMLAKLDTAEMEQQQSREAAGVDSARSAVDQLRTAIAWQTETLDGDIALKKADLATAEARLKELLNGSRPQEVETARAAANEAAVQNQQAQGDWKRAQTLYKNEDISTSQYEQFRTKAETAAAALKRASEQFALVKEGPRQEQIQQQRAVVDRARAAVRLAEANRLDLQRRKQELVMRVSDVARAEAQKGLVEVQLHDRMLISPIPAVVLSKSAEPGEVLAGGATVLTLGDISKPWVRGYVGERDLGRIKLGLAANVRTDSYPGKSYKGKVTYISSEAEFTPKQIQTQEERQKLVYRIKIEVENPNQELKSNMPVDAEIRLR
ncbi:MAG: efflux RND transporter periplasmic adaptor subunit [Acidobacteria bacterium]|nr:efflux RND transporter periplasmic adaptor subunit [Acidobacteriota bacterium]